GVHPVEVGPALDGGPGLDQQLVGDPSAQEIVAGHQVLVRILLSVLGEVRVAPAALLSLAETAGILDHAIEGDQGRYAELPHSGLLSCAGQVLPATSSAASTMLASICTTTALVSRRRPGLRRRAAEACCSAASRQTFTRPETADQEARPAVSPCRTGQIASQRTGPAAGLAMSTHGCRLPPAFGRAGRAMTARLYPWYEIRFYRTADARTSRWADDGCMSVSR